ncbi:MAG: hypothetical protein PHY93_20660 [Bacteriovorax sp.]|nr:hypothetical protein [Bacteriovorax sp.]
MKLLVVLIFILSNRVNAEDIITSNLDCPFSTTTYKEDQDTFSELKNYFKSYTDTPDCNKASAAGLQSASDLQSVLDVMSTDEAKCISKNIDQTKLRDLAFINAEKGMEISSESPYSDCNLSSISKIITQATPKDKITKCISDKYSSKIDDCKSVAVSQSLQDKVGKGVDGLQKSLTQTLSSNNPCGLKAKDTLKMTMDTLSKVKAISAIVPVWGSVAGIGVDLLGTAVDKYFPTDAQTASTLMDAILDEENYEKNACVYFNLQQKLYCTDKAIIVADPKCNKENSGDDLVKLLENVQEIKKATNIVILTGESPSTSNLEDTTYLESKIDDLTKYAKASEPDLRNRIKTLPKVQQAKELEKINYFFKLLDIYQFSNPDTSVGINVGQTALQELMPLLYSSDISERINFEELAFKSTPGLKMDAIKQRGLIRALQELLGDNAEEGRRMAKYNNYKNTMNGIAQNKMASQLGKNVDDFKQQLSLSLKQETSVANDLISEGMLRNIVRHCALMQEVYDPQLEGKIPKECAKINCGSKNRLNWFIPKDGQANITQFKKSYCEKSLNYKKIEDEYVKELKDSSGAKICGSKISDYLEINN